LQMQDEPLLNALAGETLKKVQACWAEGSMSIQDLATDLNGLTWALEHAEVLSESLSMTILGLMRGLKRLRNVNP